MRLLANLHELIRAEDIPFCLAPLELFNLTEGLPQLPAPPLGWTKTAAGFFRKTSQPTIADRCGVGADAP